MKKLKRILAIIGIVLLLGLYISTLLSAIFIPLISDDLFKVSIFSTVVIPCMLYAYMLIYKLLKDRNSNALEESKKEAE
jgi:uncharacterized membrane protein YqjE